MDTGRRMSLAEIWMNVRSGATTFDIAASSYHVEVTHCEEREPPAPMFVIDRPVALRTSTPIRCVLAADRVRIATVCTVAASPVTETFCGANSAAFGVNVVQAPASIRYSNAADCPVVQMSTIVPARVDTNVAREPAADPFKNRVWLLV